MTLKTTGHLIKNSVHSIAYNCRNWQSSLQKEKSHKNQINHPYQLILKLIKEVNIKPYLTVLEMAHHLDHFPLIKHNFLSTPHKIVLERHHQLSSSNRITGVSPEKGTRDHTAKLDALPLFEAYIRGQSLFKNNIKEYIWETCATALCFGHFTSLLCTYLLVPGTRAHATCPKAQRSAGMLLGPPVLLAKRGKGKSLLTRSLT